jgi:hypothetical protein
MSIESNIRDKMGQYSVRSTASLPIDAIPYALRAFDALIILLSAIAGGISYHLLIGDTFEVAPACAIGALASLVYILRLNGADYYELQESAKPHLEVREILVCWLSTGLLLTLIAFLLKISAAYSRGAFLMFFIFVPHRVAGGAESHKSCSGTCCSRENSRATRHNLDRRAERDFGLADRRSHSLLWGSRRQALYAEWKKRVPRKFI